MALECSICLCTFKDPVSIPCGHIYCTKCLADHVNVPTNEGLTASCPTCRADFHLVQPDLTYLPKKYHPYIVPSLRRVFIDTAGQSALTKKLKKAEARVKELEKQNENLLQQCEKYMDAARAHREGEQKANQRAHILQAEMDVIIEDLNIDKEDAEGRAMDAEERAIDAEERAMNAEDERDTLVEAHKALKQEFQRLNTQHQTSLSRPPPDLAPRIVPGRWPTYPAPEGPSNANTSTPAPTPSPPPAARAPRFTLRKIRPLPKSRMRPRSESPPPNFNERPKRPRLSEGMAPNWARIRK